MIAGSIIGLVGVAYGMSPPPLGVPSPESRLPPRPNQLANMCTTAALEFVPSIEPPQSMRDSQWDGEQV